MGAEDTGEEAAEPAVLARPGLQLAGVGSTQAHGPGELKRLPWGQGSVGPRADRELWALCLDPRTRMVQKMGGREWQLRVWEAQELGD